MDVDTTPVPLNPEAEELAKKLRELAEWETELAEQELHVEGIRVALSAFERRYLRTVGALYAELDSIEAQIAEIFARSRPSDQKAQHSAAQARTRANDSRAALESSAPSNEFVPSQSLKALYRQVAKGIHPDLTSDPKERLRRQRIMAEANLAYERGDEAALRKILDDYEKSPEVIQGEGTAAELIRAIRKIAQIKKRITEIKAEVKQLLQSDLSKLKTQVEEAEKQGRDLLKEMAEEVSRRIAERRERLQLISEASLVGLGWTSPDNGENA